MKNSEYYPCSIVEAWNILCEAVWERAAFYGVSANNGFHTLPEIPAGRRIPDMIGGMRNTIINLVSVSLDWRNFGKWSFPGKIGSISNAASDFYGSWQIDGYSFLGKAPYLPYRRHTVSAFIAAASEIVRQVVRYPAPEFADSPFANGFVVDGTMSGEFIRTGEKISGSWIDHDPLDTGKGYFRINDLSLYQRDLFRGRWHNLHWIYRHGKSLRGNFILPQLRGTGCIRNGVVVEKFRQPDDGSGMDKALGIQTFEIDFDSGRAAEKFDFSAVDNWVGEIYDESNRSVIQGWVNADWNVDREVLLTADNFCELPYKHLCDNG